MVERFDGEQVVIPTSIASSTIEVAAPRARRGSVYAWLFVLLVLIVLISVSQMSEGYQRQSATATRQARQTAAGVAGLAVTATAEGMQS